MKTGLEMEAPRRGFLGWLSTLGVWFVGAVTLGRDAFADAPGADGEAPGKPSPGGDKPRWGMAIDLDRCTSCGGCVAACRSENNVPPTTAEARLQGTEISWMTLLHNEGESAHAGLPEHFPTPCMHCEDPPCIKVCPVGATYQDVEGIVQQIWDRCIGCRFCENACPYSRRYFNWGEPEWPESYRNLLNPDVATRSHGVVEKCTFCVHRLRDVKELARREKRALTDDDVRSLPACAQACPTNAITFGDLNDPHSTVSKLAEDPRATRLLEHVGTKPKVVYLRKTGRTGA